jgi:hypothetical protein
MNDADRAQRSHLRLGGYMLLLTIILLAVLLSCALSRISIQRGLIHPPLIREHLGPVYLIARTTLTPQCMALQCGGSFVVDRAGAQRTFVVWVVIAQRDATGFHVRSLQLAQIPLDERPALAVPRP